MSTVFEIEAAIEQLPPEDFHALHEWMAKRAVAARGRMWSPEELGAAAAQMVAEEDPEKAKAIGNQIIAGWYGDPGA